MSKSIDLTVLANERALSTDLVAEHAWAVWLKVGARCVLWDVGQGDEARLNAQTLQIDLGQCDAIILSHGHYDHTGGLKGVVSLMESVTVYAHPLAFVKKFRKNNDGSSRENGMPEQSKDVFLRDPSMLFTTPKPTHLGSGLWVTGEIPRRTEFENSSGAYFSDPNCIEPDPIRDDQALFFESANGIVVILGCAHAGVVNTVEYVSELVGGKRIHAILGGLHLIHASKERIQSTVDALVSWDPDFIGLAHCTGEKATSKFKATFGPKCVELSAGTRLSFEVK